MLGIGLIGYGYWGPNIARNFSRHPACTVRRIADQSPKRQELAAREYRQAELCEADTLINATDVDVVAIATPVSSHHALAKAALEAGKHVWVEKPMTHTSAQARELCDLAAARDLVLMVDHTFLFTGVVQKMKELVAGGDIGELLYYDSVRVNLGIFQHDVNVIWDLAPHDLSIMDFLLDQPARALSAHGSDHFGTGLVDVAYLTVEYDNNLLAHFHLNWLSPVKVRRTLVGGTKRMMHWDDVSQDERLRVYDKGMEVQTQEGMYQVLATPRIGDMWAPVVPGIEALASEVAYFVACVEQGTQPHNNGEAGLRIVRMLEASDISLRERGRFVTLGE